MKTEPTFPAINMLHTPLFTQKMLVVSTRHYPLETERAIFDDESAESICSVLSIDPLEYGWLIYVTEDKEIVKFQADTLASDHPALMRLMKLAHDNGFAYLKLDKDGLTLPEELGFEIFDR